MKKGIGLPLVVVTLLGLAACNGQQDRDTTVGDPATTPAAETGPGMAPAPDAQGVPAAPGTTGPGMTPGAPGTVAPGTPGATAPGTTTPGTPGAPGTMQHDTLHQPGIDQGAPATTGKP